MLGKSAGTIVGVAAMAALLALTPAEELPLGPTPQEGLLMLRNGEAIRGKISRVGELYYVSLPSAGRPEGPAEWAGGEIRVKAADVDFCCRNLQEAYVRKRAAIVSENAILLAGDVRDHLRLAQWCLRQGLLGPAGRELADAIAADPTHPMIGVLERRLRMAVEPAPPHTPTKPIDPAPSPEELDRLIGDMPPGVVEAFTQTIQPLLLNTCTTAGCHGPQSESRFRLLRIPPGRPPSRRLTQRNLQAAVAWVDRENPAASRLLTTAVQPHGTVEQALFGKAQAAQYKRLVDWVGRLSEPAAARVPETVDPKDKPPVRAMSTEPEGFGFPLSENPGPAEREPAVEFGFDGQQRSAVPPSVKRGAPLPVFVPVDPFDAEIFNRRYFGEADRELQR